MAITPMRGCCVRRLLNDRTCCRVPRQVVECLLETVPQASRRFDTRTYLDIDVSGVTQQQPADYGGHGGDHDRVPLMNGMRQPHSENALGSINSRQAIMIVRASANPTVAVV